MKQDYQSITQITYGQIKTYLLSIENEYAETLIQIMSIKQFKKWFYSEEIHQYYYIQSLKALYQVTNYEDLEYHLVMMNHLYVYESYIELKEQIYRKLIKKKITLQKYCVLRHLFPFSQTTFQSFINNLYENYHVSEKECAYMCLLEDQHYLAYQYLLKLDNCDDVKLLELLSTYSLYEYMSLIHHYEKRKRDFQFVLSH